MSVSKEKNFFACVAIDNVDMRFLNFAIEYLHKNEKVRETVFACSYEAQVESLSKKNWRKSRDTISIYSTSSILTFFLSPPPFLSSIFSR